MLSSFLRFLAKTPHFRGKARLARAVGRLSGPVWLDSPYGVRLEFDPRDATSSYGAVGGGYDDVIASLDDLERGMNFVDIGANAGVMSLIASGKIGPEGRCFAFEPNVAIAATLVRNIERNGLMNVRVLPFALSDDTGFLTLTIEDGHSGRAYVGEDGTRSILTVDLGRDLPDITSAITSRPFFIKIDVEGHEGQVLGSIAGLLRHANCRRVIVEIEKAFLARAGSSAEAVYGILTECGLTPQGSLSERDHYNEVFDR